MNPYVLIVCRLPGLSRRLLNVSAAHTLREEMPIVKPELYVLTGSRLRMTTPLVLLVVLMLVPDYDYAENDGDEVARVGNEVQHGCLTQIELRQMIRPCPSLPASRPSWLTS